MLFAALTRMIGPHAGIAKAAELVVLLDQPVDFGTGRGAEFADGDLTDDAVAGVAPGERRSARQGQEGE
jgi:hypothetical protein